MTSFRVNFHLARFSFMKSTHFFLHFLASSLSNSIACGTIPFYISEKAAYSPTTNLPDTFQVQHRECSDKWANALWPRYRVDVTSLLVPSLSTPLFCIQYALFWGILSSDKKKNKNKKKTKKQKKTKHGIRFISSQSVLDMHKFLKFIKTV